MERNNVKMGRNEFRRKEVFLKIMERKTKEFLTYAQTLYIQTEKLMREE